MSKFKPLAGSLGHFLFTLPFLVLFLVQLAHHQMWRDEVNVFAIGQVSPTFGSLLYHVHYEGHPWLWYTLVWLLTKVTSNPSSLKLLAATTGVAVYLIVGMASPFRRVEKLLLFLSYFILFEYAVFARMYGLQLLFVLLYLRGRSQHPQRVLTNSLFLGLAASLDMTGIILSFALACEYLWTLFAKPILAPVRRIWSGAAVYAVLTLISIETLYPTRDLSIAPHHFTGHGRPPLFVLAALVDYAVRPFLPTLRWDDTYWNPSLNGVLLLLLLALPLVLAAFWRIFRHHSHLMVVMSLTLILSLTFGMLFYIGFTRHFGVTFVAFVACLWMLRASGESLPWPAYVLLGCAALSGIDADVQSWRVPFSNAKPAASYLEDPRLMSLPWAGYQDFSVATLSTYTGHPIFQLNCFCAESFFFLARQRDVFDGAMVPALDRAYRSLGKPEILYIGDLPLQPDELSGLAHHGYQVRLLRSFTGAAEPLEDFYIYDMKAGPGR